MDPFSVIAGISGICATGVSLMVALYKYVEDVRDVPHYIESLLSELSAVSSSLQSLKELVTRRGESRKEFVLLWAKDFGTVLEKCDKTFCKIDVMIKGSKIKTKSSTKGQVVKCIRWEWHKDKVEAERDRLERYRTSIELMLKTLDSQQIDNISDLVEKIHQSVSDLQENRKYVKEVLEVMENGHPRFESADYTLTHNLAPPPMLPQSSASIGTQTTVQADSSIGTQTLPYRESNVSSATQTTIKLSTSATTQTLPHMGSNVSTSTQTSALTLNTKLLDSLQATIWAPVSIRCGRLSSSFQPWPISLVKPSLRIVVRWDRIASVEICNPSKVVLEKPRVEDRNSPQGNASDKENQEYFERRIKDALVHFPSFNEEAPTKRIIFELTFSKFVRQSPTVIRISPGTSYVSQRWRQRELDIEFTQKSETEEFLSALEKTCGELKKYWKSLWLNYFDLDGDVPERSECMINVLVARTEEAWSNLANSKAGQYHQDAW